MIPLPCENMTGSTLPSVFPDTANLMPTIERLDSRALEIIANALSQVDVSDM